MLKRILMGLGIAGIGSLAYVGVGSYASYTSSASLDNAFKTGTFQLEVQPNGTPSVSGNLVGDANYAQTEAGTLRSLNNKTLAYSLGNANPGDSYTYGFTVWDAGSLQGAVNQIVFTPNVTSNPNVAALQKDLSISVYNGEGNLLGTTTAGTAKVFSTNGYAGTYPDGHYFGPNFLQPEQNGNVNIPGSGEGHENYKVVVTYNNSGNQNNEQGLTTGGTFTVNGSTL